MTSPSGGPPTEGPYVIGCDVGSQGTNVALYSAEGELVASSYQSYDLSFPFPGAAEQDADAWPRAVATGVREVLSAVPEGPSAVKGISFGSQLDGMVVCDEAGRALRPAMIWMDRRAEAQAARVAEHISREDFYGSVGANLDSSHAVFKALWVRDEEPEIWARASWLMSPGTFVLRDVAGPIAVDYSNASSLALLDPRSRKWSSEVLAAVDVPESMLPELGGGTDPIGHVTAAFAEASGLDPSTVVAIGCGDEMAATLGAGVFAPGEVCDVVGTAEPVCAASAEPREDPTMLVECHPHADPDAWLLENPGFVSGGNLRWWRDQFAPIERGAEAEGLGDAYDLLSRQAERIEPGAEGLVFLPAMQGAMAPEWNGSARGVFYGLTLAHTRAHMTRAVLEGSAFGLRDILEAMIAAGLDVRRLTIVGGGAKGPLWRQIKADVTGLPVRVPINVETTATGAAILAAVASGVHGSVAGAVEAFVAFQPDEHEPDTERRAVYDDAYRRYRDVYSALKPVFGT
jgi:xylulokinase